MKEQLLAILNNSKNYTLGVAEMMPGNTYNFKPVENAWNFKELLHHIAYGIYWWEENFIRKVASAWEPPPATTTKEETLDYLKNAFAVLKETIDTVDLNNYSVKGFHAAIDHITHHRGQATV